MMRNAYGNEFDGGTNLKAVTWKSEPGMGR